MASHFRAHLPATNLLDTVEVGNSLLYASQHSPTNTSIAASRLDRGALASTPLSLPTSFLAISLSFAASTSITRSLAAPLFLRLPLLAVGKVLSVAVMAEGLGEKEEELAGQLAEVVEPWEKVTGEENLSIMMADRKGSQAERRAMAESCR